MRTETDVRNFDAEFTRERVYKQIYIFLIVIFNRRYAFF